MNVNSEFLSDTFKNEVLEGYCNQVKNARTRIEYIRYIILLCDKLLHKDFLEITEDDAFTVFDNMKDRCRQGTLARRTICVRLSCYNSISRYIELEHPELKFRNPFRKIERPEVDDRISPSTIPSLTELDKIMTAAKQEPMFFLILAISTRTGLSASKIIKITKDKIIQENDRIGLYFEDVNPKKTVTVVLPIDITQIFLDYVNSVEVIDDMEHIFYNNRGNALTLKNLDTNIARIIKNAGILYSYTLKDMRTRAIMDMINAGADEESIQKYVGIGTMRARQFADAKGFMNGCPADLVNYQIKQ